MSGKNQWLSVCSRICLLAVLLAGACDTAVAQKKLQYNRDVRPILLDTCFACHGPDSASRKADLRLDQREAAIDMSAIEPGKPDESEMIRRILSDDPDEIMPPPETKKTLSAAQKQTLVDWISQGAEYELHWSYIPPVKAALPTVKNTAWGQNEIDRFILARLEAEGLVPNEEADRHTLARRVSLDLTGLPPAPELVDAFVTDHSPDAYEKLVDKLLESPRWGEHRGRYWLDYARYADTHGIHFDNYREMWSYREWVINAFNRNMSYDQFTIESLAGDLLPDATLDQRIGSGFNRCNMTTNEGGIIDEEYRVLYARDRTETTAQVWMGLTAGCAVCHSHKFDPLSQTEFYELAAFFNNTTQPVRDGNVKDTPPILSVPRPEDRARFEALLSELPMAREAVARRRQEARPAFDEWLMTASPNLFRQTLPARDLVFVAALDAGPDQPLAVQVNGETRELAAGDSTEWIKGTVSEQAARISRTAVVTIPDAGDFDSDQRFSCAAWVYLPANDSSGALVARMDDQNDFRGWDLWVEGRRVGSHIISRWNQDAIKVVSKKQIPANQWVHVAVTYDGSRKAEGVKVYVNGQPEATNVQANSLTGTIRTDVPFKVGQRNTGSLLSGAGLQQVQLYRRVLEPGEVDALASSARYAAILAKPSESRTEPEVNQLYDWWLPSKDEAYQSLTAALTELEREEAAIRARGTIAHVMQERNEPAMAYVLNRGEYDQRREEVKPDTPEVLPAFPADFPRNRLGFARWLLLPDHPLTARVTVNRYWNEVFGTGIVSTVGDLGVSGQLPSHPELLDWLAVDFRENGWDVKRLFKQIVMSAAYRQSAHLSPEKLDQDPDNRLMSRGPRFRMDAEMVRDYALAASGLLVDRIGGPSVKPYQPPGVWEAIAMNVSNTRSYDQGTGDDLYRRSMYTFVKRMAPPAPLEIFNAPSREFCVVDRERTNTPLQALVTLNDEQFVEAARNLAQRALLAKADSLSERLAFVSRHLLCRPLRPEEITIIQRSLTQLLDHYRSHSEDAAKLLNYGESPADPSLDPPVLAAWTMLVNQLMNLDEVLNK